MNIPSATTIHSGWHIPAIFDEDDDGKREQNQQLPFHQNHVKLFRELYAKSIETELPITTFLDEVWLLFTISPLTSNYISLLSDVHDLMHFAGPHCATELSLHGVVVLRHQ